MAYTFVWDEGVEEAHHYHRQLEEDAELLQHYHHQLDSAFQNYQQASPSKTRALIQQSVTDVKLSSDSDSSISSDCKQLDITAEGVSKSRILGNTDRWHHVVKKMKDPDASVVKIAILGGSVPAGHQCAQKLNEADHNCAWPSHLETMLRDSSLHNVEIMNLARGGYPSSSGITQIMELMEYDAIIIQWTANDDNFHRFYKDEPEGIKPFFETLIRTALALPKNPAVILFEGFGMRQSEPVAESVHLSVARVYDIPVISARAAFWNLQKFHEHVISSGDLGFSPGSPHMKETWHKRFACLMYENWIQESTSTFDMSGWTDAANQPPVFGGTTLDCKQSFQASAFTSTLENSPSHVDDGWSYYADVNEKYGFISNSTNSTLSFDVVAPQEGMSNELYIHYLRSYSPEWGTARVEVSNQGGEAQLIQSHTDAHESQLAEIKMKLGRSSDGKPYKVTITNVDGKVKIVELFLYSCKQE